MAVRRERATSAYDAQVGSGGRLVIPIKLRRELGLEPGTRVRLRATEAGSLEVTTPRASLRLARALVRKYVPAGVSLADELIRERRAEAELEST